MVNLLSSSPTTSQQLINKNFVYQDGLQSAPAIIVIEFLFGDIAIFVYVGLLEETLDAFGLQAISILDAILLANVPQHRHYLCL